MKCIKYESGKQLQRSDYIYILPYVVHLPGPSICAKLSNVYFIRIGDLAEEK